MADDSLSDEDKALFRRMMDNVRPLKKNNIIKTVVQPKPIQKTRSLANTKFERRMPEVYLSDYYHQEVQAETVLSFSRANIPNKRLKELKLGQIPWQAKLDLHGFRPDAARQALIEFLEKQSNLTHRSLLIVHGKGSHQGEAPILKNLVNQWLPQFSEVLAFHSALPRDGGVGALYLLLKRQKT